MISLPTRQKALEASIFANTYSRGCLIEIMEIMQQRTLKGQFMFVYIFSPQGNEHLHDKIIDYLKIKRFKIVEIKEHLPRHSIKISW